MKRLLLAVASVALAGVAGTGVAYASTAHPVAGFYSEQMVVFDCPAVGPQVKPASYVTFCGDGGDTYAKMDWTSWTPKEASATSLLGVDNCTPNCAGGHTTEYPAINVLWGSAAVKGHPGELAYTHMTVIFPGAKPAGFSQTTTITLYLP
jgi:hypothetical protein